MMQEREAFISTLRRYRAHDGHAAIRAMREQAITELRSVLDYPRFNQIDVDKFFSIMELGHLMAFPKPTIKKQASQFSIMLRGLSDEKIDVAERYTRAVSGKHKIRGVGAALVTKVLTVHDPSRYFVENNKSTRALKRYGIELPRGLSAGEKYKMAAKYLSEICHDVGIEDLAVLDYYLYLEGSKAA